MITPHFTITQDDEFIHLVVKISSIRFSAAGMELVVQENLIVFYLSPYYLRLRFPHNLVDDERAKAEYKASDETINIQIPKENKYEFFENLDLPTTLLAREGDILGADNIEKSNAIEQQKGPLIQEVSSSSTVTNETSFEQHELKNAAEKFNWEIEQKVNSNDLLRTKYGFNDVYDTIIGVSQQRGNDINELYDPEHTSSNDRVGERLTKENAKFDPDYYISEYMTNKHGNEEELELNGIRQLLVYTPPIIDEYLKWYNTSKGPDETSGDMPIEFNEKEQKQMQNDLPKKSYLVENVKQSYITIINLLASYLFEQVENECTHNTESPWTIGIMTPQISSLDQQLIPDDPLNNEVNIIKVAIITFIRRSLCFPLHRNFDLSKRVLKLVYYILCGGKRLIIKCLLDIHEMFRMHDIYYVYNKVLIDDLCSWFILEGNSNIIRSLAIEFNNELSKITKENIDFDLMADIDPETGQMSSENMTLREMEVFAEHQFTECQTTSD